MSTSLEQKAVDSLAAVIVANSSFVAALTLTGGDTAAAHVVDGMSIYGTTNHASNVQTKGPYIHIGLGSWPDGSGRNGMGTFSLPCVMEYYVSTTAGTSWSTLRELMAALRTGILLNSAWSAQSLTLEPAKLTVEEPQPHPEPGVQQIWIVQFTVSWEIAQ